jgi:hypothetical protein
VLSRVARESVVILSDEKSVRNRKAAARRRANGRTFNALDSMSPAGMKTRWPRGVRASE